MIPDSVAAVRSYLVNDPIVQGLVGSRIYGGELPRNPELLDEMPTKVITLSPAGGIGEGSAGYGPLMAQRLDARCYGSDGNEAWTLHLAVRGAMKALTREVRGDCLLHSVTVEASGSLTFDNEGKWPMVLGVYSVLSAEVPVSA